MNKMYRLLLVSYLLTITVVAAAQSGADEDEKVQMAEGLRSSGKIYVVVAVLMVILAGLFFYLVQLDRKLKRLEKDHS
jgi:CcmD family protein